MIRGFFSTDDGVSRPYVPMALTFPDQPNVRGEVYFIIDTGADLTILSLRDARLMGLEYADMGVPGEIGGVGGIVPTRVVEVTLSAQGHPTNMTIHIPERDDHIPSLLGRDFISAFTLIIRERDGMALLLDDDEADALNLPS